MDSYKLIPPGLVMFIKEEIDQKCTTSTKQREEPSAKLEGTEEKHWTTTPTDTHISNGDASSQKNTDEITVHIATEISNIPIKSEPKEAGMISNDTTKAFKRSIDEKFGSQQNTLRKHARTHLSESVSEIHDEKYACNSNDSQQYNRRNSTEKNFEYKDFDKRLTSEVNMMVHNESHCRAKHYGCKMCDKSFLHTNELDKHSKTHIEEKPFKCEICGKCFKTSQGLSGHARFHTGEKLECKICGQSFKTSHGLSVHARFHTGEKLECKICGKCFNTTEDLEEHKRSHTGEKAFKCELCGKHFIGALRLAIHKRLHTKQKLSQ